MGTIHLSRNLANAHAMYIASIRGALSITQPVLLNQSINGSHQTDVLPILCVVLFPSTVHLAWIKAHIGTEGNEEADTVAKEGAEVKSNSKAIYTKLPHKTVTKSA